MLSLEYFDMMILCSDYLLDIAMTWITGGYMLSEYQLSPLYFGDKFRHFVGQVPPNRAFPVQPHLPFMGKALMRSIVMSLAGSSNEGRLWVCATLIK